MLKPKKMHLVRIFVIKSKLDALVKQLHEQGFLHIKKSTSDQMEEGRPLATFDDISAELLRLRAILAILESVLVKKTEPQPLALSQILPATQALWQSRDLALDEKLKDLNDRITALAERLRSLGAEAKVVEKLAIFKGVDFGRLNSRAVGFKAGEIPRTKRPLLLKAMKELEEDALIVSPEDSSVVLVLFDRKRQSEVESTLSNEASFGELPLPAGITTPKETADRIRGEMGEAGAALKELQRELGVLARENIPTVRLLIESLEVAAERAEVAAQFAESKSFYIIEGWITDDHFKTLEGIVAALSPGVVMQELPFGRGIMPPTVLDNPEIAQPAEFVTRSYSMPNYFELDPTMLYFFTLPIVYGMIVGDVLYGIMSLGIAYWLMKKFEKSYIMYNVCRIWMYSAIPSILFGILFDEYGGMSHLHLLEYLGGWTGITFLHAPLYAGFHRMENVLMLVALTAFLGMIHLAMGFVAGAVNNWEHNRKHAIGKLAWIVVEVGGLMALLPYLPGLLPELGSFDPVLTPIGVVLVAISAVVIGITEGLVGVIELPGFMGNVLSYTRIAAVGIVGIVIAELINQFLRPLPSQGLAAIIMMPIFAGLHIVNCFIAMFESLIQGGRLNIVEFRAKFLEGGGETFAPFGAYAKKQ